MTLLPNKDAVLSFLGKGSLPAEEKGQSNSDTTALNSVFRQSATSAKIIQEPPSSSTQEMSPLSESNPRERDDLDMLLLSESSDFESCEDTRAKKSNPK